MLKDTAHHCYYIDHTFFSAQKIGEIYSGLAAMLPEGSSSESIILATCQRIEVYSLYGKNFLADTGLPFRYISGRENIKQRLVRIASGVESQILGERNIFHQVKEACRDVDSKNELRILFDEALTSARWIRDTKKFHADMNYEDISLKILEESMPVGSQEPVWLLIIGSGMLARNFLEKDELANYEGVRFITRSPRNLKKKFGDDLKKNVLRCNEVCDCQHAPYHCIIATNKLDSDNYFEEVKPILCSPICRAVFDLSAVPLFQGKLDCTFYADTYSDVYFRHVDTYNERKLAEAQKIKNEIMRETVS